ncbi:hypothetical protein FHR24_000298 [Wenyingzhuangia heitensis]|uniref:DoxX-like family protein n=1 Tax=Wenyingzhuangia heitensis TaxID=1487859 RepID=A0ABX0U4U0_9FLAO|nr:hypothetical protein [Wenyingzhuangia heitensis]NIJ43859.1 hypothetical protein [Wenyingzhuangia heitensis]
MTLSLLCFLFISFGYSLFEKLKDKKGYTLFLANHLKNKKLANLFWWFLVCINSVTTIVLFTGLFSTLLNCYLFPIVINFKISAITILILLLGQRIAGDFQGAANLGIYMILTILGWYLSII